MRFRGVDLARDRNGFLRMRGARARNAAPFATRSCGCLGRDAAGFRQPGKYARALEAGA